MIIDRILKAAPPGTAIPKPAGSRCFVVKGKGVRRGQTALIYTIPNHRNPERPYEKGVTNGELAAAHKRLLAAGELSHEWFNRHLHACAAEGSCNFTTIGGLFQRAGWVVYAKRGLYRRAD